MSGLKNWQKQHAGQLSIHGKIIATPEESTRRKRAIWTWAWSNPSRRQPRTKAALARVLRVTKGYVQAEVNKALQHGVTKGIEVLLAAEVPTEPSPAASELLHEPLVTVPVIRRRPGGMSEALSP